MADEIPDLEQAAARAADGIALIRSVRQAADQERADATQELKWLKETVLAQERRIRQLEREVASIHALNKVAGVRPPMTQR